MQYISTRGMIKKLNFEQAMLSGLARDGGLYMPQSWPKLDHNVIAALAGKPYEEVAFRIIHPFIGATFNDDELRHIITRAYRHFRHAARAPLVQLDSNHFLLELFYGPTLAFKDIAMQLIGQMFQVALARRKHNVTIVGATSGDTGSAAMAAFRGLARVKVFILYPHGRVSDVQRRQMTTQSHANSLALAVDGDFDICQALLKDMFNDFSFRDEVHLAGINSINWGRILAQVVYFFTAALAVGAPHRSVSFCVPTGNFGDIFAAYVAQRMGLPIKHLVIATNHNDILHRTLQSGSHIKMGVFPSSSPSMDIQVSSNFERLIFELYRRDTAAVSDLFNNLKSQGGFTIALPALQKFRDIFHSGRCTEAETLATIKDCFHRTGRILCPHTAVAVKVAGEFITPEVPMISLATAHPAKFPEAVKLACGFTPNVPAAFADLFSSKESIIRIKADLETIKTFIRAKVE